MQGNSDLAARLIDKIKVAIRILNGHIKYLKTKKENDL